MGLSKVSKVVFAVAVAVGFSARLSHAQDVIAGLDFLETRQLTQVVAGGPSLASIPAGFFGPGSDPFTGTVLLQGIPLSIDGTADTVVRRLADAHVLAVSSQDTIPIEIIALHLRSVQPITVTYNGGQNPQTWIVDMTVPPSPPQLQGQMTIFHSVSGGGTFDAILPVQPLFTFTNVANPGDVRQATAPQAFQLAVQGAPWSYSPPQGPAVSAYPANFYPGVTPPTGPRQTFSLSTAGADVVQTVQVATFSPCETLDLCVNAVLACGPDCFCWQPATNTNPPGPGQGSCVDNWYCDDTASGVCPHGDVDCTDPTKPVCYLTGCYNTDGDVCAPVCGPLTCSSGSTTTTIVTTTTTTTIDPCSAAPEVLCSDMIDNDCDNRVDCADPDCNGVPPCPIARKDPTDIRFEPGLDRLRSQATLDMLPVDIGSATVGILLSNSQGVLYEVALPGSALTATSSGKIFRYRHAAARTSGGLYSMKIKQQKGGGYVFSTISYADLTDATPDMRVQFYVGDMVFITTDVPWKQIPLGWRAPKDH
jgi:hypothetical protein